MSDVWVGALSGFLGALVGGSFALAGTWLTERRRAVERAEERADEAVARVRETATAYLRCVNTFAESTRDLYAALLSGRHQMAGEEDRLYRKSADDWTALVAQAPAVELVGAPSLGKAAEDLRKAWGAYSEKVDEFRLRGEVPRGGTQTADRLFEATLQARQDFVAEARR